MKDRAVIDASVIGAILFREPEAEKIEDELRNIGWVVPVLADYEVSSIYLKKIQIYPDLESQLSAGYRLYFELDIDRVDVPVNLVVPLARQTNLSIYDASYFWLAQQMGIELYSRDKKLMNQWRQFN